MKPQRWIAVLLLILLLPGVLGVASVSANDSQQQSTFVAPVLIANSSFLNVRTGPGVNYSILATVVGGTEMPVLGVASDGVWYQVNTVLGPGWVNVDYTIARGDFTNVPLVDASAPVGQPAVIASVAAAGQGGGGAAATTAATTATTVSTGRTTQVGVSILGGDMFTTPDNNGQYVRRNLQRNLDAVYPILDAGFYSGELWYLFTLPGVGTGWMNGRTVQARPLQCSPSDSVAITTVATSGLASGTEGYVIRIADGVADFELVDKSVVQVPFNLLVGRPSTVRSFCEGVVSSVAVTAPAASSLGQGGGAVTTTTTTSIPVPQIVNNNRVIVNTGNLNVRSGPGGNYTTIVTLPGGTELAIVGRAPDDEWYLVQGTFGLGWVDSEFTIFRGDYASVPLIAEAYSGGGFVTTIPLTTVAAANSGQGGGVTPPATTVTTSVAATGRTTQIGVSITGGDMFTTPDNNGERVRRNLQPTPNEIYPVLDAGVYNGELWFLFTKPGVGTGWMNNRTVRVRPLRCTPSDSVAITTVATSGLASGTEGYVIRIADGLADFELVDKSVVQVPFNLLVGRPDSVRSFCEGVSAPVVVNSASPAAAAGQGGGAVTTTTFVPVPQVTTTNRVIINTGNLNVRSGPGGNYSVITSLPGGTELAIVGRAPDDEWFLVQGGFGLGWVDSEFTIFRGDYASVPLIAEAYSGGYITSTLPVAPVIVNPGQGGGVTPTATTTTTAFVPVTTTNRIIVNTGNLNVRSGPGAGFSTIATLPGGTELPVVGRASDGVWHLVQGSFGQGWINIEFAIFRGDYASVPILNIQG